MLILLESDGESYAVLTEQVFFCNFCCCKRLTLLYLYLPNSDFFFWWQLKVRVPVGKLVLELPAGMLDDENGDIVGTAVREVSLSHSLSCIR